MTKRQPKGSPKGGQFAPDTSGKTPPSTRSARTVKKQPAVKTPDTVKAAHSAYKTKRKKASEQDKHDPLCPWRPQEYWREMRVEPQDCQCELIAQVRTEDAEQEAREAGAPQGPVRNGHQFAPEGECSYCDQQYEEGNSFFPPHRKERSRNCGGGSNFHHCTCSACF